MSVFPKESTVCGSKKRKIFGDVLWLNHTTYQKTFSWAYALISNEHVDERKIWPSLSLASAEAIKPSQSEMHFADLKMPKKEQFLLHFLSKIFIFPQLFLWLQKIVLDLIYWMYKKNFGFCQFHYTFLAPDSFIPKITKNG